MEIEDYSHQQRITKPPASGARLIYPTPHLPMHVIVFLSTERKVITEKTVLLQEGSKTDKAIFMLVINNE